MKASPKPLKKIDTILSEGLSGNLTEGILYQKAVSKNSENTGV
jgi:hypothetical protein